MNTNTNRVRDMLAEALAAERRYPARPDLWHDDADAILRDYIVIPKADLPEVTARPERVSVGVFSIDPRRDDAAELMWENVREAAALATYLDANLPPVDEAVPQLIAKVREHEAKLARVEALHKPSPEQVDDAGVAYRLCLHCTYINRYGRQRYPCPTVTALNERDDQ